MPRTNGTNGKTIHSKSSPQVVYKTGNGIAWLALTFSIISLGFTVLAFNMTSDRTNGFASSLGQEIDESFKDIRLELAKVKAASQLTVIESRQRTTQNFAEFEAQATEVRNELRTEYEQADRHASGEWQDLNLAFDTMLSQIKNGTLDALTTLQSVVGKLRQNI